MAARCASCSYALSVSDSVSCCECKSYFHIDCAQLVGFPYYELSSDPIRNTFHCQTCKILPLPRQGDFSDSDSDSDDYTMPSRQVEYHLEGHSDFAADMNEVKGTVQDLSDLCKDMFREISELKSINLALRCCVENLKLDGDQRDKAIADLKRRLDALEGKQTVGVFKAIDTTDMYIDVMRIEKEEEPERYLTPDPEFSKSREVEALEEGRFHREEISPTGPVRNKIDNNLVIESSETENISETIIPQKEETYQDDVETSNIVTTHIEEESQETSNENIMHFAEEETIPNSVEEDYCEGGGDWSWRGHEAIQQTEGIQNTYEEDEGNDLRAEECSVVLMKNISEEEDDNNEIRVVEGTEQDWEILEEDASAEILSERNEETLGNKTEETDVGSEGKRVTWADEEEEAVEKTEDVSEGGERISLKSLEEEEKSKLEEDVGIVEEDFEAEGRTESPRVEGGGDPAVERGEVPEGELEGGQSPDLGEVQPSELPESSEPLPPPQPQHTPDDLWDYLKETVSGEHPATVEEFVQKLIGTLEHVPEEYLKPVIDYNIKRATSPSVTDGEHLESKEGDQQLQGEALETETGETQDGAVIRDENPTAAGEEGAPSLTEEGYPVEDQATLPEDFPEDRPDSAAGYSALEAAS